MQKVSYVELTPEEFLARQKAAPIAYLPMGTLEWHSYHLPLGSDCFHSQGFLAELAAKAGGIVLPPLFLAPDYNVKILPDGTELYGMDCIDGLPAGKQYPHQQLTGSAYWVPDETFGIIIEAILKQLARAGFKIVVAHGHGPSRLFFAEHIDEYNRKFKMQCFSCISPESTIKQGLGLPNDHAGKTETSLNLVYNPDLVHLENLSEDVWPLGIGGTDHPKTTASAELGRKIIDLHLDRMSKIIEKAMEAI